MKKGFVILIGLLLSISALAQDRYSSGGHSSKPKSSSGGFDPQRLVMGGGFGLGFGSGSFNASISPLVGYKLTNNLMAGVSIGYQYFRESNYTTFYNTTTSRYENYPRRYSMFSPGAWVRYNLFSQFFVQAHFEYHISDVKWTEAATLGGGSGKESVKANYSIPTLLVGAGYRLPVSERISLYLGLYYDVLQKSTLQTVTSSNGRQGQVGSPYYGALQPVIGFGIGF
ncbi:hypothetical protein DBR32_13090 [Taibaiella sp. KBW10]|uniref:hypothetical protein n=1 Tax=Taibaiella sp. KBW10 TaxID=2153357 RepID=UPI000F5B4670|nr:hypothetical protein [Taibaiella sp. KBW10]RQO30495.1 hypothetical protein DBR32_13090 [Taibaiella sp. KBW10]